MSNVLPSAPPQSALYPNISAENPENFRLTEISRIEKEIGHEAEHRRLVLKKYKKARKVIHIAAVCLGSLTSLLSAGALAASLTGVGAIAAIPVATVAAVSGAAATGLTAFNKKLERKVSKHTKIHALATAKHDTINSHVSKALDDNRISDQEFQTVTSEIQKYRQLKETLRSKFTEKTPDLPQPDIEKIKKELHEQIMKKLAAPSIANLN